MFVSVYDELATPAAGLLQLARHKAGITQAELARRAGVPASMVSAYERDRRQPTLATLLRLLKAAGYELRMHLAPYDDHDDVLAEQRAAWARTSRKPGRATSAEAPPTGGHWTWPRPPPRTAHDPGRHLHRHHQVDTVFNDVEHLARHLDLRDTSLCDRL